MIGDLHSVATQLVQVLKVGRNGAAFVLWTHDNRLVYDVTPQKREFRDATINAMFQHDIHVACWVGGCSWVRADCIILPEPTLEWQMA